MAIGIVEYSPVLSNLWVVVAFWGARRLCLFRTCSILLATASAGLIRLIFGPATFLIASSRNGK